MNNLREVTFSFLTGTWVLEYLLGQAPKQSLNLSGLILKAGEFWNFLSLQYLPFWSCWLHITNIQPGNSNTTPQSTMSCNHRAFESHKFWWYFQFCYGCQPNAGRVWNSARGGLGWILGNVFFPSKWLGTGTDRILCSFNQGEVKNPT